MKLQTDYGQAVMWSKGFAAEETKAAFARAAELAAKSDDFSERFAAAHGQWTMARVRGELRSARELTSAFLREAEEAGRVTEAGVARRGLALISYLHGDFVEARTHCERALAISDPEHEEEARERYGEYTGTVATACLAADDLAPGRGRARARTHRNRQPPCDRARASPVDGWATFPEMRTRNPARRRRRDIERGRGPRGSQPRAWTGAFSPLGRIIYGLGAGSSP